MNIIRKYIIVDDDQFSNTLCSMIIKRTLGEADTEIFDVPEEGLAFIEDKYSKCMEPAILFLDINMPSLTGWEFVEQYEKFSEEIKNKITIYILSSSVDARDEEKAASNKYVKGFISKPLESSTILSIAGS
jgi:two-component SAPR family response regulator